MPITLELYDVQTMLGVLDSTPRPRTFLREKLFGGRATTFPTEEVMIDIKKGRRRMAPFVSPFVGGKLMEREGYSTQIYRPALVQPRDVIGTDRLKKRQAGESVVSSKTPAERLEDEQAEVLDSFDQSITRREEWMVSQLIFTGGIHIVGDGVDELFTIGFDNIEILAGDDLWSAEASDPFKNLKDWRLEVIQESGISCDICIMAENVADAFINHAKVQNLLDVRRMETGIIKPTELPNGATYIGTINRLGMDIYTYNEWYIDDETGLEMPMVPDDTLAIVPSAARNPGAKMLYGAWTEVQERKTYEAQRIPRIWVEKGQNAEIIEVVSRPLPTMVDSDGWYVATVL